MSARARLAAALLALLLVGACSHSHSDNPPHRLIFSPNGEPLSGGPLGFPTCPAAIGAWFDRLDTLHQGRIARAVFIADARRQFHAMDLNGDGVLTPDVLLRYRTPYTAGVLPERSAAAESDAESEKAGHPGHEKMQGTSARRSGSSAAALASDVPDPVMSADTRLLLRVTLPDFERHANQLFDRLNTDHNGTLSRAEALLWCDAITPAARGGGFLGIF